VDELSPGSVSPYVAQQLLLLLFRPLHQYRSIDHSTTARPAPLNDRNQPIASGVENDGHRPRWKMNLFQGRADAACLAGRGDARCRFSMAVAIPSANPTARGCLPAVTSSLSSVCGVLGAGQIVSSDV